MKDKTKRWLAIAGPVSYTHLGKIIILPVEHAVLLDEVFRHMGCGKNAPQRPFLFNV